MSTRESEPEPSFWKRLLTGQLPLEHETVLFLAVSILDIVMTYWLLSQPRVPGQPYFVESNPIARYFINHWGERGMVYFKMGMCAFVCVLTQIIAQKHLGRARFVLMLGTIIVGFVVTYSLTLALRLRGVL
jgi:hypothetical protein